MGIGPDDEVQTRGKLRLPQIETAEVADFQTGERADRSLRVEG
jgi:hypothetical protein